MPQVVFVSCAGLSSLNHDQLKLPFRGMILTLVLVHFSIDAAIWRVHYSVAGMIVLSSSTFELLFICHVTFLAKVFARRYSGKRKRFNKSRLKSSIYLVGIRISERKSKTANPVSVSCRQILPKLLLMETCSILLIFLGICRSRSTLPPLNPQDKRSKITFSDCKAVAASSVTLASETVLVVALPNLIIKFTGAHSDTLSKSRGVSIEFSR